MSFFWQAYFNVAIGVFGTVTNLVNISVLINPKLRDMSYRYMLIKSIIDIVYLILSIPYQVVNICYTCPSLYSISAYSIVAGIYLMPCLAVFSILIGISLSVYIYSLLANRRWFTIWVFWLTVVLSASIAFIFYLSRPFAYDIVYKSSLQGFFLVSSKFGLSQAYQILSIIQYAVRILSGVGILTIINIINVVKFRNRFSHRLIGFNSPSQTGAGVGTGSGSKVLLTGLKTRNLKSVKNITQMVIVSAFIKVFLEMPYSVCVIISLIGFSDPSFFSFYYITGGLLYLSPSLDILVYYLFNKNYRNILNGYLRLQF